MIKSIVFDFDKMLHLTEDLFSVWATKKYGLSKEAVNEFFTKEFSLCRIGKLDTKKALEKYISKFRWEGSVEEFMQAWYEYGNFDDRMIKLINELKEKKVICVLSTNNEKYRMQYYIEKYDLGKIFDHLLISANLGFLKPEKEMFEEILKVTNLEKEEILFCDDKESFIKAAKNFGFKTYSYGNFDNFVSFLKETEVL